MITNVKWKEHPILGDLEIDLTNEGVPYKTIVFAGENGTGKTTIMESLNTFLSGRNIEFIEYIKYNVGENAFKIEPLADGVRYGFHTRVNLKNNSSTAIRNNHNNRAELMYSDTDDIRKNGTAYSKARSGFSTKKVTSTTTQSQLDSEKFQSDDNDDYTEVKQLLINISVQDNSDFVSKHAENNAISLSSFNEEHSRMLRFTKAFNNFFRGIKFNNVDHSDTQEKKILFHKGESSVSIDSLSTGEKQIVFRGAYLLKNKENLRGSCIFVDEPELSMHPKWQRKILKFYQDLFTQDEEQFSQIMLATHSEYVLESAFNDDNTQVILLKQGECGVIADKPAPHVLNYLTLAEVNYLVFDIASVEYHSLLYGYIQNNNPVGSSLVKTDDYISNHNCYLLSEHEKISPFQTWNGHTYKTLSTYIRNAIDHPEEGRDFESLELECSIKLMIEICKQTPPRHPSTS